MRRFFLSVKSPDLFLFTMARRAKAVDPVAEEELEWVAEVEGLIINLEEFQWKSEEDNKFFHEQIQNQAIHAQTHKDEVMQNLKVI